MIQFINVYIIRPTKMHNLKNNILAIYGNIGQDWLDQLPTAINYGHTF